MPDTLRFRIAVTGEQTVRAVIEFDPPAVDTYEAKPAPAIADTVSLADLPSVARAKALWSTAREWVDEFRSPVKRRARQLHQDALDLTHSTVAAAVEFKDTTVTTALELTESSSAASALAASALELRSPVKRRARQLQQNAIELTQSTVQSAFELDKKLTEIKQSTAASAKELTQSIQPAVQSTVASAIELKDTTVSSALELKQTTVANALELKQQATIAVKDDYVPRLQAKVAATSDTVARGLADVTNQVASRTQQLADGPTAKKATRGLGLLGSAGASVVSKVRSAEVVSDVSEVVTDVTDAVSGVVGSFKSSILDFVEIQRF